MTDRTQRRAAAYLHRAGRRRATIDLRRLGFDEHRTRWCFVATEGYVNWVSPWWDPANEPAPDVLDLAALLQHVEERA